RHLPRARQGNQGQGEAGRDQGAVRRWQTVGSRPVSRAISGPSSPRATTRGLFLCAGGIVFANVCDAPSQATPVGFDANGTGARMGKEQTLQGRAGRSGRTRQSPCGPPLRPPRYVVFLPV